MPTAEETKRILTLFLVFPMVLLGSGATSQPSDHVPGPNPSATSGVEPTGERDPGESSTLQIGTCASTTLWDQTTGVRDNALSSQVFQTLGWETEAADDFVVPADSRWLVEEVRVLGTLLDIQLLLDGVNVTFYADDQGKPGVPIAAWSEIAPQTASNEEDLVAVLPEPVLLEPGTYWLSLQVVDDSTVAYQWFWAGSLSQTTLALPHWRDRTDVFETGCVDWDTMQNCRPDRPGDHFQSLYFSLHGIRPPTLYEADFGADLALADDQTVEKTFSELDFTFNFAGRSYSGSDLLSISSNGFISLGGSNGADPDPDANLLLNDTFARIAPAWMDLDPGTSGGVHLNAIDDGAAPGTDRVIVTWDTETARNASKILSQLQLWSDGTIVFAYTCGADVETLVGISPGGAARDPGIHDFSRLPHTVQDVPTLYETFGGVRDFFDLDLRQIVFNPNGTGYRVGNLACPAPPLWENDLGPDLALADDETHETTFGAENFSFLFNGINYSGSDVLSISSNGFLSIGGSNGHGGCRPDPFCNPSPSEFVDAPFGRIAPFWANLNPEEIGQVFLNLIDDGGSSAPDRLVVTWVSSVGIGTGEVSVQAQLFPDGTFLLNFACASIGAQPMSTFGLVGTGPGGGAINPGETTISNAYFDTGSEPTIYQRFNHVPPPSPGFFDLKGRSRVFQPNGNGGYYVTERFSPLNDLCLNAFSITPGQYQGTLVDALWNAGFGCALGGADVWYRFTAPCAGELRVDTCGTNGLSGVDSSLAFHDGCFLDSSGPLLDCNDNSDRCGPGSLDAFLSRTMEAGESVSIRLARARDTLVLGEFLLNVDFREFRSGSVNTNNGAPEDVLTINGSSGSGCDRTVSVAVGAPISVSLGTSSQGPSSGARYVLWAWPGSASQPTELVTIGESIGWLVNPTPLQGGMSPQPFQCLRSPGLPAVVCNGVLTIMGPSFAPFTVTRPGGLQQPAQITLQALLRDHGASNGTGFSLTNAVVLQVQ